MDVLANYFRDFGCVSREVRLYERSIDLIYASLEPAKVFACEAKVSDWRRALGQAIVNLAAADYSYIAVWSQAVHRVRLDELSEYGVGLISVGTNWKDVAVVLEPTSSKYVNGTIRERLYRVVHELEKV